MGDRGKVRDSQPGEPFQDALPFTEPLDTKKLAATLDQLRPYLLAIANAELPHLLNGKIGPSDVVQSTIARGYEQFGQFRGTTLGELARWLRQILLNHLRATERSFASEKREILREQPVDSKLIDPRNPSPSRVAVAAEEVESLKHAMSRLTDDYRVAISLRYAENLSFAEMGTRLGRSEEAARKLWARAVKQLQQELQSDDRGGSAHDGRTR